MKANDEIIVSITIPNGDGIIHKHSAHITYDEEHDVMATDFLCEVIDLMKYVFGETDTENAIDHLYNTFRKV